MEFSPHGLLALWDGTVTRAARDWIVEEKERVENCASSAVDGDFGFVGAAFLLSFSLQLGGRYETNTQFTSYFIAVGRMHTG